MKQFIESCASLLKFIGRMFTNSGWWPFTFILLVAGCLSNVPTVTSGQHLTIGIWVPIADGQTFGVQFIDYLQGSKFVGTTNCVMEVQHKTASTNEYFAVVKTNERVEDKFKLEKKAQATALQAMKPTGNQFDGWTTDSTLHTNDIKKVIR